MALPAELHKYLSENGRSLLDGYIRFLDETSRSRFESLASRADVWNGGEPFAITAFGDLLVWDGTHVLMYRFVDGRVDVILAGFTFFFANVNDAAYQSDFFDVPLFNAAQKELGPISDDECYTFEPLPMLGGTKDVAHMNKGKTFEYLSLIIG